MIEELQLGDYIYLNNMKMVIQINYEDTLKIAQKHLEIGVVRMATQKEIEGMSD